MTESIRILDDIFDAPGVDTLEGVIGPLLAGARGGCHFIHLPPRGYWEERAPSRPETTPASPTWNAAARQPGDRANSFSCAAGQWRPSAT